MTSLRLAALARHRRRARSAGGRLTALTALAAAGVLVLTGCQTRAAAAGPTLFTVKQMHLSFRAPAELVGLTYVMSRSGEGKPAANFSTRKIIAAGGPGCAAATSGSGYPIGQLVLSPEKPQDVAEEQLKNPEDPLGDYVTQVGTGYLYYTAPPPESCADDRLVGDLQRRTTRALRSALKTVAATS